MNPSFWRYWRTSRGVGIAMNIAICAAWAALRLPLDARVCVALVPADLLWILYCQRWNPVTSRHPINEPAPCD